jgi:hypothetical protein
MLAPFRSHPDDPGQHIMSALNLDAIQATPLQRDPFDFLVVPGCIPAQPLEAINNDYPAIQGPGNLSLGDLQYGPAFESLIDELEGQAFAETIGSKFGVDLTGCPTTITVRKYCEQSDGNIHTDHRSKIITVLLYFNTDWSNDAGRLRMLRSNTDIEDFAAEVPPIGGTLLAFRRTDDSYHGHKQFVGERRMLQLSFLRSTRLALWRQRLDRIGTRVMKRAAGVVGTR